MSMFGGGDSRQKTPDEIQMQQEREKQQERADRENMRESERSFADAIGRSMGKRGSRAFFTNNGAGYSRTLGASNVVSLSG